MYWWSGHYVTLIYTPYVVCLGVIQTLPWDSDMKPQNVPASEEKEANAVVAFIETT